MNFDVTSLLGLVFQHPKTGIEYGPIRSYKSAVKQEDWEPIAEDSCGNVFFVSSDGSVAFWDHETDDLVLLSPNWEVFLNGCIEPKDFEFDESQVESVRIDPEFAKECGIDVPNDGWIKKKKKS